MKVYIYSRGGPFWILGSPAQTPALSRTTYSSSSAAFSRPRPASPRTSSSLPSLVTRFLCLLTGHVVSISSLSISLFRGTVARTPFTITQSHHACHSIGPGTNPPSCFVHLASRNASSGLCSVLNLFSTSAALDGFGHTRPPSSSNFLAPSIAHAAIPAISPISLSLNPNSSFPAQLFVNGSTSIFVLSPCPWFGSFGIMFAWIIGAARTIILRCLSNFTLTVTTSSPTTFFITLATFSPTISSPLLNSAMLITLASSIPSSPNSPPRSPTLVPNHASLPTILLITSAMTPFPALLSPCISIHFAHLLDPTRQYPIHLCNSSPHFSSPSPHSLSACIHLSHLAPSSHFAGTVTTSNHLSSLSTTPNLPPATHTTTSSNPTHSPASIPSPPPPIHVGPVSPSHSAAASIALTTFATIALSGTSFRTTTSWLVILCVYHAFSDHLHTSFSIRPTSFTTHLPPSHLQNLPALHHTPCPPLGVLASIMNPRATVIGSHPSNGLLCVPTTLAISASFPFLFPRERRDGPLCYHMPPRASTSTKTSPAKSSISFISIAPGVRLYSEDHLIQSLHPLPFTRRSFRAFLRSLSVPTLHIGRHRYVDHISFALAVRSVLRVGAPSFYGPGSRRPRRIPPSRLDLASFRSSITTTIAELLASRHYTPAESSHILSAAKEAASRMLLAGFQSLPPSAQHEYTRRALRRYLPPDPPTLTPEELPEPPA